MLEWTRTRWRRLVERANGWWRGGTGQAPRAGRWLPRLEELGERIVPSAAMPLGDLSHLDVAAVVHHHHHHTQGHSLAGTATGTYFSPLFYPDAGHSYQLTGRGTFGRLGSVAVKGAVNGVAFIQSGHATGTLTLSNANGSVTLSLVGPEQPGFSRLPEQFNYQVASATGAYAHLHASGTLHLQLTPTGVNVGTFSLSIRA
jgi:hypothetical protein